MLDRKICEEDFKTPTQRYAPYAAMTFKIKGVGVLAKIEAEAFAIMLDDPLGVPEGLCYTFILETPSRQYVTTLLPPSTYKKVMKFSIGEFLKKVMCLDTYKKGSSDVRPPTM